MRREPGGGGRPGRAAALLGRVRFACRAAGGERKGERGGQGGERKKNK